MLRASHKALVAAVVHNRNDQSRGLDTQSQEPCERRFSHVRGASVSLCHDFLVCRRKVRVDQHYDASGLGITTKSPG